MDPCKMCSWRQAQVRLAGLPSRQRVQHRGQASIDRPEREWAILRLIHRPVHASWLNQIEIYFSTAASSQWGPGRSHLDKMIARIEQHEQLRAA